MKHFEYKTIVDDYYKYRLVSSYQYETTLFPIKQSIAQGWVSMDRNRILIHNGYAWDGASGPAVDTKNFMRGSLVHDALYQLIQGGYLDRKYKKAADQTLYNICREDGMSWFRAQWVYRAVRIFGLSNDDTLQTPKRNS